MTDSRRYLHERGHELLSLGYEPIPIRPGTKAPTIKQWQSITVDAPQIDRWLANGSADAGVGVRTGALCAIDIDITDKAAVKQVVSWCDQHLGPAHRKQGQAPKVTLLYRRHTPGAKVTTPRYTDLYGNTHQVEVLGTGQQTVMYHTHPGTHRPYRHSAKQLPPLSELPVVTDDELRQLLAFVDDLASDLCWDANTHTSDAGTHELNPGWDEEEQALAHLVPRLGVSLDEAAQMLQRLDASDHTVWTLVAAALQHEFGPDGFDLFDTWSQTADNYGGTDRYHSFSPSPHDRDPITLRTVRKLADDAMAADPASLVGDEPTARKGLDLFAWADVSADTAPPHQVVQELLVRGTLSLVSAQPNTGKSALMLDLAAHVARGEPWRGLQVEQGTVLYVAAESPESIRSRVLAMKGQTGWAAVDLLVTQGSVVLTQPEQRKAFASSLREHLEQHPSTTLLIIDTFRNATPGLEENDSKDMGSVIQFLALLARRTGLHIVIIHHTTKAGTSYAGSGVFGAVVDTEIRIEIGDKDMPGLVCARVVQQRSLTSRGVEYWYRVVGRPTGRTTNFGLPETAPLVEHVTAADLEFMRVEREEEARGEKEAQKDAMLLEVDRLLPVLDSVGGSHKDRAAALGWSENYEKTVFNLTKDEGYVEPKNNGFRITETGKERLERLKKSADGC